MNEHFDPTLGEALDRAREFGWRVWLNVGALVLVAVLVLGLINPVLLVVVTVAMVALLVLLFPDVRAVARALFVMFVLSVVGWMVVEALFHKQGLTL